MTNPIDRLLRGTLNGSAADNPPTPCLDPEIAAAFADDTLTRHERSRVEAHVAGCLRCQTWLAALEKTRPPAAPRAWWRRPAIAWLAPIAAVAAALIVWINFTAGANVARSAVSSQTVRNDTRPVDSSKSHRDQPRSPDELQLRSAAAASAPTATGAAAATQKHEESIARSESRSSAQARSLADHALAAPAAPPQSAAVAPPPPEAPLPSRSLPHTTTAQPSAGPASAASSQNAAEAAATPAPMAETPAMKTASADRVLRRERFRARDSTIDSTDPRSRWRITITGVVQHSADGGASWHTQSTGVNLRLTAGSSPSRAICWLVGPGGTVVLTTDEGRTWQRLAFPESVDLVAVRATDSDTAEIITADARTFRTSDRGRTWSR